MVRFDAELDKLPNNYRLVVTPKLYNQTDTVSLRSVIFAGRVQRIKDTRAEYGYGDAVMVDKSNVVTYQHSIPFEKWMANSSLDLSKQLGVCGKEQLGAVALSKDNLQPIIPIIESPAYSASPIDDHISPINARIMSHYPFAIPAGSEDLGVGLRVTYPVASSVIDYDFGDNRQNIDKMREGIKSLKNDFGATITHITIEGSASIEGRYDYNKKLAERRSRALVTEFSEMDKDIFAIDIVGEDWNSLIELLKVSDIKHKDEALAIIANYPVMGGREKKLMDLRGGRVYRQIQSEIFPLLRSASYIRIFYDIDAPDSVKKEEEASALIANEDYQGALEILNTLNDSPSRSNLKGVCHMMLGDADIARDHLNSAISGGNKDALINLQKLENQQNNIDYK